MELWVLRILLACAGATAFALWVERTPSVVTRMVYVRTEAEKPAQSCRDAFELTLSGRMRYEDYEDCVNLTRYGR